MTIFHFFNCAILTFGPHAVYYSATPLSEYDTIGTSVKAALVYLGTALVKIAQFRGKIGRFGDLTAQTAVGIMNPGYFLNPRFQYQEGIEFINEIILGVNKVIECLSLDVNFSIQAARELVCLATFLKVPENDSFDPSQELLKAIIGFIDVAGLYFALTQLTHRNISQNHKFQAVGLGWAVADSVLHRLAPLWVGARGLEFTGEYILQGLEGNANLVLSVSLAALLSLIWLRKNKPRTLIPIIYACAGILATMPSITSYLRRGLGWNLPKVVGFELFSSLVMAFVSWQLFSACQRPSV